MKQLTYRLNVIIATVVFTFLQLTTFAQETTGSASGSSNGSSSTKVEITTDSGVGGWFGNNWIWVVGGILLLVLLIALLGGGSSRSRTTVVRDDTVGGTRVTRTTVDEV